MVTRVRRALAHLSLTAYAAAALSSGRGHRLPSVQKPRAPGLAVKGCENYLALIFPVLTALYLALGIGTVIFISSCYAV